MDETDKLLGFVPLKNMSSSARMSFEYLHPELIEKRPLEQKENNEKDRIKAEYDYQVNRKAEREIREIKEQLNRIERKLR